MNRNNVHVLSLPTLAAPRGARWAAEVYGRVAGWFASKPSADYPHPYSREALQVRELAYRVQDTDPGFAADLFAAAARHEGMADMRDPWGRG
jgi:hypothetical protein